ncbi:MAG: hypothetical protein ACLFUB_06530 [Cyclobacteriaceae bacterium]
MIKNRLIKRLSWYYPTEKFNIFLMVGIAVYLIYIYSFLKLVFPLYGLIIMAYILYQGQHYWKLKLWRLKGREVDESREIAFFLTSKKINLRLILLAPLVLVIQVFLLSWQLPTETLILGLITYGFGILEHINYYHTQLMIDNIHDVKYLIRNKKFKKASLAKDLQENKL